MNIDIDSYAALAQGEDDIEVDLDESDFNDPHLLVRFSILKKKKNAITHAPIFFLE